MTFRMVDTEHGPMVVAEEGGQPVGRMRFVMLGHIEDAWIEPKHRGGFLLGRMEAVLLGWLKNQGATRAFAFGASDEMESYLSRLGWRKTDLTVWRKEI